MSIDYNIEVMDGAQNALNKMARAQRRGTGCHINADEIRSLSLTRIGEMWSQDDPRRTGNGDTDKGEGNER
jgi:hypothetical protein